MQSMALVWVVAPLLALGALYLPLHEVARESSFALFMPWIAPLLISFGFAALVWLLKAATLPGAGIGFLVCMIVSQPLAARGTSSMSRMALPALMMLFLLTFLATRFGRGKKESRHVAERRSGRRASQIVANLGVAALCGALGWYVGCIAALAEATADTVSSEVGQAVGARALLITTGQPVPAGTDGGLSVAGTATGIAAAALVVAVGMAHIRRWPDACLVLVASCAGLFFDSVLGATVEARGWLGNDLVNFCSTLFAAGLAVAWIFLRGRIVF